MSHESQSERQIEQAEVIVEDWEQESSESIKHGPERPMETEAPTKDNA